MSTVATPRIGAAPIAGAFARATPTVSVTAPSGTVSSVPFTVSWTYSSPVGRAQTRYRIRILSQDGTIALYDSAIVAGAGTSASVPFQLSGGSTYTIAVSAADQYDWSVEATSTIFFDGATVDDIEDLDSVGTIYEIGINGVGYMLADHPDRDMRYERRVVPLDPQRLATSDTPFSEAIDRYSLIGFSDWSDGAGQRYYKRAASSDKAYYSSAGVNPFTPGEVRLLPSTAQFHASTYDPHFAVVAGGKLYLSTASGQLVSYDDPSDTTATTITISGASHPTSLATDGTNWYFADGANIYRNSTAAAPASAWSTEDAVLVQWCSDRVVIAKKTGSSTVPNALATLNYATGAISGPASGSAAFVFEEETDIRSITSGDGYVWWAAARNDQSVIYSWRLGSTDSYVTAFELPAGQDVRSIGYYQGNVFVRARELVDGTSRKAIIYRAVPNDGRLVPTRVLELDGTVDHGDGDFSGDDRFVYFSWRSMGTTSGVGCIDLATGGWAKWIASPANTGRVRTITQWNGRTLFTVDGYGTVLEQVPAGGDDKTVTTGQVVTSLADLNTSQRKGFGAVVANFDPLPANSSITVHYSIDGGTSFTALSPSVSVAGVKTARWDIDAESDSLMLRIELAKSGTASPVLRSVMVRAYPVGLADQVVIIPVNCADNVTDLRGRPLPENGQFAGVRRARRLEELVQSKVKLQDLDWRDTRSSSMFDVVGAETRSVSVHDRHAGRQSQAMVTMLTLRRSLR